jgi:hypothetical protein
MAKSNWLSPICFARVVSNLNQTRLVRDGEGPNQVQVPGLQDNTASIGFNPCESVADFSLCTIFSGVI